MNSRVLQSVSPGLRVDLVDRLLRPRSIAIIGFSAKSGSFGASALSLLERDGFAGAIHLVGRSGGMAGDLAILASVDELPADVDLAILALPAAGVPDAVMACVRRGVGSIVIFASGFAELGDAGRDTQAALSVLAEQAGVGVAGPNCLGFVNYVDAIEVGFLPGPELTPMPDSAKPAVAIVVQSGGLMGHILWALQAHGVPVAYQVSTGNEAVLGLSDYIAYLADDPAVSVIAIYAEHIRRPAEFLTAVARARAKGKPIVMLHTGRSQRAQKAAASHTGALAGDHAVMTTAVRRAGVLVIETIEQLIDCTEFLFRYPTPPTADPAIATSSGAMCAIAHDTAEDVGMTLPALSDETRARLRERLPAFVVAENPVDLGSLLGTDTTMLPFVGATVLADTAIGSLVVITPTGAEPLAARWVSSALQVARENAKPVAFAIMGDDHPFPPPFDRAVRGAGLLMFRSPERALRTIARITEFGRSLARGGAGAGVRPAAELPPLSPGPQPEWLGKQVLRAMGVAVPDGGLARDADEAATIASQIGYPVVLKIQSAELTHKTEIGGVILDLAGEAALREACATMLARVANTAPGATIDGLLVEAMSGKGLELVVGAKRDPNWGPVVMVGLGGIMVEALGDVRLLPPDLDTAAIVEELGKLKSARLLGAFRGMPARDLAAVADVVAAVGRLMLARPDILEIDINPLVAKAEGGGALALDALIVANALPVEETAA